jgi:ribonucleoside-triphosphate reductase
MCGQIVQVGGVRRAAEISLSDLDDLEMRNAKQGQFWNTAPQRAMANNSAVFEHKPDSIAFLEEFLSLAKSGTGERGIFNRESANKRKPKRRKAAKFGVNPCGEIWLRNRQFCNLSIAIARHDDTEETLTEKVRLAAIFGTLQSTLTNFKYVSPEWKKNCEDERLLGVDITGQMDCPLLHPERGMYRVELLKRLQQVAVETNKEWAARLGIAQSAAVTCVKPSGNSAQLFGCSSGLHPRYAKFYIRRFRIGAYTPIAKPPEGRRRAVESGSRAER